MDEIIGEIRKYTGPDYPSNYHSPYITTTGGNTTATYTWGNSSNTVIIDEVCDKKTKRMNRVSAMMKRLLDADTQTLVKAGFLDQNLELTEHGCDALDAILFDANKAALVKLAQEKLDEAKASK